MQRPQRETVTLNDILITEELSRRSPRLPNLLSENQALHTLARQLVNQPEAMLQTLIDIALDLCFAGSAGVSLLEVLPSGSEVFRWNVLAGTLAQYVGGTTPRKESPCGVCLDRGSPVLFSHPERYFTYFQSANTPIVEGLVLPLIANDRAFGSIWIMSHQEQRHFDSEDVRVMTSLADFTAAALLLNRRQTGELLAANAALEAEIAERLQAEERSRVLIENLPGGAAFVVDRDLRYLLAEGEALAAAGFKSEDLVGQTIFEVLPPELTTNYEVLYRKALAGESFEYEHNAHDRTYISRGTPLRSANGEVYAVFAVSYDISDRLRAEERLRRAAELDAFRVALNDAVRSLSDPEEIQYQAARTIGEYLGTDRAYYVEIDEVRAEFVVARDWHQPGVPSHARRYPLEAWPMPWLVDGQTWVVCNVDSDPAMPGDRRESYRSNDIGAAIVVPLIKSGRLVATLATNQRKPRAWTPDEVALVQETAERTWAAVERARAEAALRESEIQRFREQSAPEQERQRVEALAELDRAKTLFFSNVSHEFRTPLTLLLAPLQDALSDRIYPLIPPHRERLELAHRNAMRLHKLVNTLLDFSRIEALRMEAVYEATDLALFTTELASVFRSAIERAGLQLIVDCPPLPEPVYVDREMWEKIVLNLLSNAFKFTLEGEIAVRLHPSDGDCIRLQIYDTGTGIPPEELPHLFERFYQVRGAASRTHEGSGIGLALVQELIKMHSGSVDVSSVLGQGTCFTVTIPLGKAHLPSDRITTRTLSSTALGAAPYVEEAQQWLPETGVTDWRLGAREQEGSRDWKLETRAESSSNPQPPAPSPSSARILLVDDNADMRNYLTRILSEYVQVEAVTNGAEALAAVQQTSPDLVLSDVMIPQMDGFELVKALRADARTREVPIILLSARAEEKSMVEGLLVGADDYLIKPFSATSLVTRVLAHLGMAQLRSDALRQEKTTSRIKDKFLAEVAHELNTPLVAILGWTRLLRSNPFNQSMLSKSLETIERNATLQAKLIEDLLEISRITAGKISLNQEPVELQQALEAAITSVSQSLKTKNISLECLLDPLPRIVQADPNRLQQIILNLLINAIKFTPDGGRIVVSLEANETQALIVLADTGCGIRADELPYIFDTFRQGAGSNKGLGLGLAIARHLVELHNGTIDAVSSGIGLGATFTVKLPILQ